MELLEFIKSLLSLDDKMDNQNIEFTVVDEDTIKIKETTNVEDINIRVFTRNQLEQIKNTEVAAVSRAY
jgi:hypothetical protein